MFKFPKINIIRVIRIPKAWLLVMLFLSKEYKQKREEDVLKFYEKGQARIARRTKQQNNDRRLKLSKECVRNLIQKRFLKWKDKVRGMYKDKKQ